MTEYHSSESELSEFEDVNDCSHDMADFENPLGDALASSKIDGVYETASFCSECNHFVKEVYNYEGVETF